MLLMLPEYALSSAILEIDVNAIGNGTYDLPTLDDEDRPGANDNNDPFGGNNGKNQAMLTQNGPVELFATGYRNIFDITLTESGKIYVFDNGPNPGWGGTPKNNCANTEDNGGAHHWDKLHLVNKNRATRSTIRIPNRLLKVLPDPKNATTSIIKPVPMVG